MHSDPTIQICEEKTRRTTHLWARNRSQARRSQGKSKSKVLPQAVRRRAGRITSVTTTTRKLIIELFRFIEPDQHTTQVQMVQVQRQGSCKCTGGSFSDTKGDQSGQRPDFGKRLFLGAGVWLQKTCVSERRITTVTMKACCYKEDHQSPQQQRSSAYLKPESGSYKSSNAGCCTRATSLSAYHDSSCCRRVIGETITKVCAG